MSEGQIDTQLAQELGLGTRAAEAGVAQGVQGALAQMGGQGAQTRSA